MTNILEGGSILPTNINNAFSGLNFNCLRITYINCPTDKSDGIRNLLFGKSGRSDEAAFAFNTIAGTLFGKSRRIRSISEIPILY